MTPSVLPGAITKLSLMLRDVDDAGIAAKGGAAAIGRRIFVWHNHRVEAFPGDCVELRRCYLIEGAGIYRVARKTSMWRLGRGKPESLVEEGAIEAVSDAEEQETALRGAALLRPELMLLT